MREQPHARYTAAPCFSTSPFQRGGFFFQTKNAQRTKRTVRTPKAFHEISFAFDVVLIKTFLDLRKSKQHAKPIQQSH